MSCIRSCCAAALWASAALPVIGAHAQTTTWEYATVADSSGELASFSVPALNDAGQVAFVATFDDALEGQALYRAEANGVLTPIADTGGPISTFTGDPAINASGLVTFTAILDDDSVSVFTGNGVALATIANTATDGLSSIDGKPFISDTGGAVVVRALRSPDGARVILKGTGAGAPVVLLASTGSYDPVDVAGINAAGVIAFEALSGGFKGVYRTTDGVTVTPVAVASAGGFTEVEALDINNNGNGTVVFFTETASGTGSLNVDTNGTPTLFADTSGPTFASFGAAAVAETGATAFRGIFKLGLNGIFAGGTGLYEKAIALNDGLLGSGVTALDTGPQAVINNGRFAFRASRGNGPSGIFVATPRVSGGSGGGGGSSAVDGLAVAGLLLAACFRRRRAADAGSALP